MTATTRLELVVPCYNEAVRLDRSAFLAALDATPSLRFLFVDDGSRDTTPSVLESMRAAAPDRIDVLRLPVNQGKAEAVRQGLLQVCNRADVRRDAITGFWDADLSAPLDELEGLLAIYAREPAVEWVWGIRLRALGRSVTRGALRHYLGRGFATISSLLLDIGAYDTQCGAKLFRNSPLLRTVIGQPFLSRWLFDVEMLSRAEVLQRVNGADTVDAIVYEHPLRVWTHKGGSKVAPADFLRAAAELLFIRNARQSFEAVVRRSIPQPIVVPRP